MIETAGPDELRAGGPGGPLHPGAIRAALEATGFAGVRAELVAPTAAAVTDDEGGPALALEVERIDDLLSRRQVERGRGHPPWPGGVTRRPRNPPVSVVILTWNALASTQECLLALRSSHRPPRVAPDRRRQRQHRRHRRVAARPWTGSPSSRNSRNLGFTKGCNIGIAACRPDEDVVLMNNDVDRHRPPAG